jgi:hypothetical protein
MVRSFGPIPIGACQYWQQAPADSSREGLKVGNKHALGMLYINLDFSTYGIEHYNEQEWELSLTVAGETLQVKTNAGLKIVAAS